jgi:hypothetical protein
MSNSTVPGNSDQIRYHQCEPWCEYRAGSSTPRSTFTVPPEGTGSVNGSALGAVHPGNPRIGPQRHAASCSVTPTRTLPVPACRNASRHPGTPHFGGSPAP